MRRLMAYSSPRLLQRLIIHVQEYLVNSEGERGGVEYAAASRLGSRRDENASSTVYSGLACNRQHLGFYAL